MEYLPSRWNGNGLWIQLEDYRHQEWAECFGCCFQLFQLERLVLIMLIEATVLKTNSINIY